jgi:molecular chaperone GrpE
MDFAMGVTMIRDGLMSALSDSGITPVETEGQFDPAKHEVVAEIPNDLPKGHIVTVQRAGYNMGNQLVRAAQVIVSAGPAEAVTEEVADSTAEGDAAP